MTGYRDSTLEAVVATAGDFEQIEPKDPSQNMDVIDRVRLSGLHYPVQPGVLQVLRKDEWKLIIGSWQPDYQYSAIRYYLKY
jgi:hypothetical protein